MLTISPQPPFLVAPNLARVGDTPEIKPVDVTEARQNGISKGRSISEKSVDFWRSRKWLVVGAFEKRIPRVGMGVQSRVTDSNQQFKHPASNPPRRRPYTARLALLPFPHLSNRRLHTLAKTAPQIQPRST